MCSVNYELQSRITLGKEVARAISVGENLGQIWPYALPSNDGGDWSQWASCLAWKISIVAKSSWLVDGGEGWRGVRSYGPPTARSSELVLFSVPASECLSCSSPPSHMPSWVRLDPPKDHPGQSPGPSLESWFPSLGTPCWRQKSSVYIAWFRFHAKLYLHSHLILSTTETQLLNAFYNEDK